MQGSTGRRTLTRNGVVAGSVWEARMRVDAVNGGIKVFNGEESRDGDGGNAADEEGMRVYRRLRRNQSDSIAAAGRKRRIWTPPQSSSVDGSVDTSLIQLPRFSAWNSREFGGERRALAIGDDGGEAVGGDDEEIEIEMEVGRKSFDDKEMDLPVEKGKSLGEEKTITQVHEIPVASPVEEKKQNYPKIAASSDAEKKKHGRRAIDPDPTEPSTYVEKRKVDHRIVDPHPVETPTFEGAQKMSQSTFRNHNRMQSIVDLVMWRDVLKSAFVLGLGTFFLISSSYAKDLNFSLISAISYLGLIYIALIFFYKSILHRAESIDYDKRDERYMVGEEEAIWLLRRILPYINDLLFKIRALFSGDPTATMKLAVLLFIMARCGSSITIGTLSKLVFFGVFTIPKICSSYSTQLAKHGKICLERFRDGWESFTHKKAVAAAIVTLFWNISSTIARIWAIFMLVVVVKCYQQGLLEDRSRQEEVVVQESQEVSKPRQNQRLGLHHQHTGGTIRNEALRERKLKKGI